MKIAILGTRGIPNNYGGFEQFAERISVLLNSRGHEVTVYSPHFHKYQPTEFCGVKIQKMYSPEDILGGFANFIYDSACIKNAINQKFDVALLCGYPTAIFSFQSMIKSKKTKFIVNVDGLEWSRSRWSNITKMFIYWAEKRIAKSTLNLVADHKLIAEYFQKNHNKKTQYIPYGADVMTQTNEQVLQKYNLEKDEYFLAVSRIEKDNNLQIVMDGFLQSETNKKFVIIGNFDTKFGQKLKLKYSSNSNLIFLGSIYDIDILNNLRYFSSLYFHGHSAGGTNPSLLEAMASKALIVAHQNIYNQTVLEQNALYFETETDVKNIINSIAEISKNRTIFAEKNAEKIKNNFSWEFVANEYENLFFEIQKSSNL